MYRYTIPHKPLPREHTSSVAVTPSVLTKRPASSTYPWYTYNQSPGNCSLHTIHYLAPDNDQAVRDSRAAHASGGRDRITVTPCPLQSGPRPMNERWRGVRWFDRALSPM